MPTSIDVLMAGGRAPDLAQLVAAAAATRPDTPLFADDGWPEQPGPVRDVVSFHAAVEHLAGQLWTAGVRPRQVVAVVLANHPRIQLMSFAAHRIGAVPALLSSAMPAVHLADALATLRPAWTLVDDDHEWGPDVRAALETHTRALRRNADLPEPADFPVGQLCPDEIALITHTSGTTSVPKLCAHSTNSIFQHAAPQVGLLREFGAHRPAVKNISCVHARATSALTTALIVGQPLAFITDERPEAVAEFLTAVRPDSLEAHPNTYIQWESIVDLPSQPLGSVTRFSGTFDAIHPRTVRRMLSGTNMPNAFFLQAYGQTETGPVAARPMFRDDPLGYDTRVVGAAAEGRELRVVDDDGVPVPAGTAGHIEARAVSQMVGYVGMPSPLVQWWPMGDWGLLREDGALELHDRAVDRIPGVTSSLALEDALLDRFTELQEVVVLAGAEGGVWVVVVPKQGLTADLTLVRKTIEELGATPDDVVAVAPGDLPMTGSKKVRRLAMHGALGGGR